jgi:hypothetical protein
MKTLTHCPKCQRPLKSELQPLSTGYHYWTKDCISYLGHRFYSRTLISNDNELEDIIISLSNKRFFMAAWKFDKKELFIRTTAGDSLIPYFEPDFSNYGKLINKLKTYTLFR